MDGNKRLLRAGAEAAEWWLLLESGELSREERDGFVEWLCESPVHVSEMLRMGELHAVLAKFEGWDQVPGGSERPDESVVPFARGAGNVSAPAARSGAAAPVVASRRRYGWLAAGAAAAAALLVFWLSTIAQVEVIQTGRGERRGVTLADGSFLRIDPESRLRVDLEPHTRNVQLEQGRAAFQVAKDAARPFLVTAGPTVVRAVGTEFGVERARDAVVVTVASGKVAVFAQATGGAADGAGAAHGPLAHDDPEATGRGTRFLTAGEQVTVPASGAAEPVIHVDRDSVLAWADGRLVFDNSRVADVVEQFNRYNLVQMHVGDSQIAGQLVSGVFDANEPDSFISVIQTVASVRVEKRGQDITLFSASPPR